MKWKVCHYLYCRYCVAASIRVFHSGHTHYEFHAMVSSQMMALIHDPFAYLLCSQLCWNNLRTFICGTCVTSIVMYIYA